MSTHPFGLRGDPFVPPATLSAKEASRLIRRRVRACNGDGGLLYPIDTCDAIHRLAHGVPDQVLALAGKALAVAAAAGARAVSPAHVKQAAEAGIAAAPSEPRSAAPEAAPAAPAKKNAAPAPSTSAPEPEGEAEDEATPAPEPEPEYEEALEPASEPAIGAFDDDDDLPPFRPASMALPSQPSEDLPEEAREWVSRFISGAPTGAPPPTVAESEPPRKAPARKPSKSQPPAAAPRRPREPESAAEAVYAAPSPSRAIRRRPRGRKQGASRMLIGVLGIGAMLAVVLRYSTPGHLATPDSKSSRPVRTSARAIEPSTPLPAPVVKIVPSEPRGEVVHLREAAPATSGEEQPASDPGRLHGVGPELGTEAGPAVGTERLAPYETPKPAARFGLEVASFIFEERARQERDRLVAAGLRARVVTTLEFGSRVYRVVIGGYPHPAAAERAADSLLTNGVVLQARVVTTGGSR